MQRGKERLNAKRLSLIFPQKAPSVKVHHKDCAPFESAYITTLGVQHLMTTHSQRKQLVSLLAAAVMPMIVGLANPNAVRGDDALTTSKIEFRIADDEPFDGSRKMVTLGSEQEIHVGQEVILNHEEVTHAAVISTEQGLSLIHI